MSHIMHVCAWWLYYRAKPRSCVTHWRRHQSNATCCSLVWTCVSHLIAENAQTHTHSHACNSRMQTYAFMRVIQSCTHACIQFNDIAKVLKTDRRSWRLTTWRSALSRLQGQCANNSTHVVTVERACVCGCVCLCPSRVFSTHSLTLFLCPTFVWSSVILTLLPPTARLLPHFTPPSLLPSKTPLSLPPKPLSLFLSLSLSFTHLFIFTHSVWVMFLPAIFIWFYLIWIIF